MRSRAGMPDSAALQLAIWPYLPFWMLVAVGMFVGMAVGVGMVVVVPLEVLVIVSMCGFGLDLHGSLNGIRSSFEGLHQGLPRGRGRIGYLIPPQVSSQRLELRERIRLFLHTA